MADLTIDLADGNACFQQIIKKYNHSGRYYHTSQHLASMFGWYEKFDQMIEAHAAFQLAIFFHDIVYSPIRKDNESRSAALAQKNMEKWRCGEALVVKVSQLILSTATHHPLAAHPDFDFFLDIDLAVLGSPRDEYFRYASAIRKEYRIFPDRMYFPGRKKVLENFLLRPQIYYSAPMYEILEKQARENLAEEILRLS